MDWERLRAAEAKPRQCAIKIGISVLSTMRCVLPPSSISVSWL
jgi:hypothetical protein